VVRRSFGGVAALVASALISCAPAAEAPAQFAGGELDPSYPTSEVYAGTPRADAQPPGLACAAARAYVDHVYGGRFDEMAALFAEDAVIYWPMQQEDGGNIVGRLRGREEIDAFYRDVIGRSRPYAIPVTLLGNETDCMMEVAARTEIDGAQRYRLSAINHFTVDGSGRVVRLISFQRGAIPQP
jgi:hypothetical protein